LDMLKGILILQKSQYQKEFTDNNEIS